MYDVHEMMIIASTVRRTFMELGLRTPIISVQEEPSIKFRVFHDQAGEAAFRILEKVSPAPVDWEETEEELSKAPKGWDKI